LKEKTVKEIVKGDAMIVQQHEKEKQSKYQNKGIEIPKIKKEENKKNQQVASISKKHTNNSKHVFIWIDASYYHHYQNEKVANDDLH